MSDRPTMTTWEDADGPIWGEYSFMTDRTWLDETDDPTVAIRTDWVAVRRREIHRSEWGPTCPNCRGGGKADDGATCGRCEGRCVVDTIEQVTADHSWPDQAAASAIEAVADTLDFAPLAQACLRRIAAGIRDRGEGQ